LIFDFTATTANTVYYASVKRTFFLEITKKSKIMFKISRQLGDNKDILFVRLENISLFATISTNDESTTKD
jgi:hypothetical protein